MSVTFTTAQYREDGQFGRVLWLGPDHAHTGCTLPQPCEDAVLYHGWCDHAAAAEQACGCSALDVQLANDNAMAVLVRLGYDADPTDLAGQADPADLLGRAMLANVGMDDSGIAATVDGGPGTGRATWVECGVRPGYYADTMARLCALATAAQAAGLLVGWA
jgi:hypothetical protein